MSNLTPADVYFGRYAVSRPLEVVQIDHTEVDVFLVDETTRKTMDKRPWLTLAKGKLLVIFDPRDVSRIFVQHPDGRFLEARARPLRFPSIGLREWKRRRKTLGATGRGERNDEQITKTALAQRQLIDDAIAKTAAWLRPPEGKKTVETSCKWAR